MHVLQCACIKLAYPGQTRMIIDVELIELMIDRVTVDDTERKIYGFGARYLLASRDTKGFKSTRRTIKTTDHDR